MGQKVNPILFRSGLKKKNNSFSLSPTKKSVFSHFLIQEIEMRKFLVFLLRSRGILLRFCKFSRTSETLFLDLDLYFTSLFGKESKLSWVRSVFKNMKKKDSELDKIKDLKKFLDSSLEKDERFEEQQRFSLSPEFQQHPEKTELFELIEKAESQILPSSIELFKKKKRLESQLMNCLPEKSCLLRYKKKMIQQSLVNHTLPSQSSSHLKLWKSGKKGILLRKLKFQSSFSFLKRSQKKNFSLKVLNDLESLDLAYKRRLFYFMLYKKTRGMEWGKAEEENLFSVNQNHLKLTSNFGRLNVFKLYRFFVLKKLKYNFSSFFLRNFVKLKKSEKKFVKERQNLLELNKLLCQSLQSYSGIEKVCIRLSSSQLSFLPSFRFYKKVLVRKLSSLRRNKDFKKYFIESIELFYFVLGSFGRGNASLVGNYISRLFEKTRKQLFIVRFLKKCLQVFFENIPKSFLAVQGIRILMKGRFNKRRRTKKIVITQGQISLQTLEIPLDYYQTQAVTLYGTFGIKVWISKQVDSHAY